MSKWHGTRLRRISSAFSPYLRDPYLVALSLLFLAFSIYWSRVSLLKYYSLNATVWDLGVAMDVAWFFIRDPLSLYGLVSHPVLWLIFPIFLPRSFPIILISQDVWISSAAFAIYGVAKHELKSRPASLMMSASYLLFPMLAGSYWFDFHYQTLFIPFFTFGYLFYLKRHFAVSLVLLLLAGFSTFPYFPLIALFAGVLVAEQLYRRLLGNVYDASSLRFSLTLLLILLIYGGYFIIFWYGGRPLGFLDLMMGSAHAVSVLSSSYAAITPFTNIDYKIFALLLIFFPLLGLPLLSKRFLPMLLPYVYLTIYANSWVYEFPMFFFLQYGALIIPFLYLGAIDALGSTFKRELPAFERSWKGIMRTLRDNRVKFAGVSLILVALEASVYSPMGPFNNKYTQAYFDVPLRTDVNWARFNALEKVVAMMPPNDPSFITGNGIPEVFPRPPLYGKPQEVDSFKNSFIEVNGEVEIWSFAAKKYVSLDYALFDFASPWFTGNAGAPGATNPCAVANAFYGSGDYGIVAYADGVFLLKKGYAGPIVYYLPFEQYFSPSYFSLESGPIYRMRNGTIVSVNVNKSNINQWAQLWGGPNSGLGPGKYNVTFELKTSDTSANNTAWLRVFSSQGNLAYLGINGSDFPRANAWTNFTVTVTLNDFQGAVCYQGYSQNWKGELAFNGVYVKEIAEPKSKL